jgi:hypothetical protein
MKVVREVVSLWECRQQVEVDVEDGVIEVDPGELDCCLPTLVDWSVQ